MPFEAYLHGLQQWEKEQTIEIFMFWLKANLNLDVVPNEPITLKDGSQIDYPVQALVMECTLELFVMTLNNQSICLFVTDSKNRGGGVTFRLHVVNSGFELGGADFWGITNLNLLISFTTSNLFFNIKWQMQIGFFCHLMWKNFCH